MTRKSNKKNSDFDEKNDDVQKNNIQKNIKATAKTKKSTVDKNNSKACNCGKCDDCKKRKIKEKNYNEIYDEEEEEEENDEFKRKNKNNKGKILIDDDNEEDS